MVNPSVAITKDRVVPDGLTYSRLHRWLGVGLLLLGAGLVINSLLGPLVGDVIQYRFSESMINQGIGLDAVSLIFVAPLSVYAGILVLRGRSSGFVLALGPAVYTMYMSVQYVIGPGVPGYPR